jgi:hypothetical protein
VVVAMTELEKLAETRVRKGKQLGDRVTGNMVVACFQHETSRELDPHLHTHCVVFNATFDPAEGWWKALQTSGMYRAQKFAENLYFHELAKGLKGLGYEIENNARNFEIKSVPASVIARFSKRHEQIEAEAERQIAEGFKGDVGELRTRIAHERRRRKIKNSTADELRSYWEKQLSPAERHALAGLGGTATQTEKADVRAIVAWADEHLFERRSVVNDYVHRPRPWSRSGLRSGRPFPGNRRARVHPGGRQPEIDLARVAPLRMGNRPHRPGPPQLLS